MNQQSVFQGRSDAQTVIQGKSRTSKKRILAMTTVVLLALTLTAQQVSILERSREPENPFMAGGGTGAEHDDSYSSDASPWLGPGRGAVNISFTNMDALCPTLLLDRDGYVIAYCIETQTRRTSLRVLDPNSLAVLTALDMPRSGRLGGFYMYLDRSSRVVLGAGSNHLLRLGKGRDRGGHWRMWIANDWDLAAAVTHHCGSPNCDYLESVMPDWSGRIWFSSEGGAVGNVNPETGVVRSTILPAGEHVANSISSSPAGVAVASDHALYLFGSRKDGTPFVKWREPYDRGSHTKPGRLSKGTGSTPVFFGRETHSYLAIADNSDSREDLLVYRVGSAPPENRVICKVPLFSPGASAAENAPVGIGDTVIIANTYGYDYTDYAGHRVKSLPGGMERIDVRPDGSGCEIVWSNQIPSTTVPKLSIRDGVIYTAERVVGASTLTYSFVAVDFRNGHIRSKTPIGHTYALDTFQLAGLIAPSGAYYQPSITGIILAQPGGSRGN